MGSTQEVWDAMRVYGQYEEQLLTAFPDVKYALKICALDWINTILNSDPISLTLTREIQKAVREVLNAPDLNNLLITEYSISGLNLIYYSMFQSLAHVQEHPESSPCPKTIKVSDLIQAIVTEYNEETQNET